MKCGGTHTFYPLFIPGNFLCAFPIFKAVQNPLKVLEQRPFRYVVKFDKPTYSAASNGNEWSPLGV